MKALIYMGIVLLISLLLPFVIGLFTKDEERSGTDDAPQGSPNPLATGPNSPLWPVFDQDHRRTMEAFVNLMANMQAYTKTPICDSSMLRYPKQETEEAIASYLAYLSVLRSKHPDQYRREGGDEVEEATRLMLMSLNEFRDIKPEHGSLVKSINLGKVQDQDRIMNMILEYRYTGDKSLEEQAEESYARHRAKAIMRYST